MSDLKKRKANFQEDAIDNLPNNKPVVYKILDKNDENIYTGVAKRGRVNDRLKEHLPGGSDPISRGEKVKIEQMHSIDAAKIKESNIISRAKPIQNKKGK